MDPALGRDGGVRAGGGNGSRQFLRYSHIFASAVGEILESNPLHEVTDTPLTATQLHLVALMSRRGPHQAGQVAQFLGVSAPAATKNIDKLERLGLLVRRPARGDRRATLLTLSAKGRRLVRKYEDRKAQRLTAVLARFQPAEIEQLAGLLERFSLALLGLEPASDGACLRCAAYIEDGCLVGQIRGGCPCGSAGRRPVGDRASKGGRRMTGRRPVPQGRPVSQGRPVPQGTET